MKEEWLFPGAVVPVDVETTAQWYTCPNCAKQSPLTLEWVGLSDEEIKEIVGPYGDAPIKGYTRKLFDQIEAALRSKNT